MIGDTSSKFIMLGGGGVEEGSSSRQSLATTGHCPTSSRPRCWSCWDFITQVRRGGYYDR